MDAYMFIDGIPGSARAEGMDDHFDILNFSHSASRPDQEVGASAGHIKYSLFTVTKLLDKATPVLWDMCNCNAIKDVTIKLVRIEGAESTSEGGERSVYMTYEMKQCRILNISVSGSAGSEAVETIAFKSPFISWTYAGADGNTAAEYDIEARTG